MNIKSFSLIWGIYRKKKKRMARLFGDGNQPEWEEQREGGRQVDMIKVLHVHG
jgi:hypothetical protein